MFNIFKNKHANAKYAPWTMGLVIREMLNELTELGFVKQSKKNLIKTEGLYIELTLDELPYPPKDARRYSVQIMLGQHVEPWDGKTLADLNPYSRYWGLTLEDLCGRRYYDLRQDQEWSETDIHADLHDKAKIFLKAANDLPTICQALIDGKLQKEGEIFDLTPEMPAKRAKFISIISALALADLCNSSEWIKRASNALQKHVDGNPQDRQNVMQMLGSDPKLGKYKIT